MILVCRPVSGCKILWAEDEKSEFLQNIDYRML
jgi:hypothetical protein